MLALKRFVRFPTVRRFLRHEDGTTAVEFGFIIGPFMLLLLMIFQTTMVFFTAQGLETGAAEAARLVLTGQAQSMNQGQFKAQACAAITAFAFIDCNKLFVDVRPSSTGTFGGITSNSMSSGIPASTNVDPATGNVTYQDAAGNQINPAYNAGAAGTIMVVRLSYQMPLVIPYVSRFLSDSPAVNTRTLVATAAFRNEP